jgi:hypothetical protein
MAKPVLIFGSPAAAKAHAAARGLDNWQHTRDREHVAGLDPAQFDVEFAGPLTDELLAALKDWKARGGAPQ